MSFNANELIEEAVNIIDDDRYEDTELVLKYFNQAQRALAHMLLLPDLKNGTDQVTTVLSQYTAAMPIDFHKNIYMAFADGKSLNTHKDLASFKLANGGLSVTAGDLTGVTDFGSSLVYQDVPVIATTIDLSYYRKPVDMAEEDISFPDGLVGDDNFDWALIHMVCAKAFDRIEDGFEGAKVNTASHKEQTQERIMLLKDFCIQDGEIYPYRPDAGIGWMGVR